MNEYYLRYILNSLDLYVQMACRLQYLGMINKKTQKIDLKLNYPYNNIDKYCNTGHVYVNIYQAGLGLT